MKTLALLATLALASCSYSIAPDGTETFTTEPGAFVRAIEILAEK